jgi:hypothetical protein
MGWGMGGDRAALRMLIAVALNLVEMTGIHYYRVCRYFTNVSVARVAIVSRRRKMSR